MKAVTAVVVFILSVCALLQGYEHPIERIILLSDVDGVIRDSVEDRGLSLNMREAIEVLLNTQKVEIVFISGSPCVKASVLHPWQEDNTSLYEIFYAPLKKWIENGTVTLYGAQGGQCLCATGICNFDQEYLINAVEKEHLYSCFIDAYCAGASCSLSKKEWVASAEEIYNMDRGFRLIDRGCEIEMQVTQSGWDVEHAGEYLALHVPNATISSGVASRGEQPFFFLKISRVSKEIGAQKYLYSKNIEINSGTLVVAFGDTQTDIGLYKVAAKFKGLSFHFGKEGIYEGFPFIVRSEEGCDRTHTEGAIRILKSLKNLITKGS